MLNLYGCSPMEMKMNIRFFTVEWEPNKEPNFNSSTYSWKLVQFQQYSHIGPQIEIFDQRPMVWACFAPWHSIGKSTTVPWTKDWWATMHEEESKFYLNARREYSPNRLSCIMVKEYWTHVKMDVEGQEGRALAVSELSTVQGFQRSNNKIEQSRNSGFSEGAKSSRERRTMMSGSRICVKEVVVDARQVMRGVIFWGCDS